VSGARNSSGFTGRESGRESGRISGRELGRVSGNEPGKNRAGDLRGARGATPWHRRRERIVQAAPARKARARARCAARARFGAQTPPRR